MGLYSIDIWLIDKALVALPSVLMLLLLLFDHDLRAKHRLSQARTFNAWNVTEEQSSFKRTSTYGYNAGQIWNPSTLIPRSRIASNPKPSVYTPY